MKVLLKESIQQFQSKTERETIIINLDIMKAKIIPLHHLPKYLSLGYTKSIHQLIKLAA
jgi:hypothetical protein